MLLWVLMAVLAAAASLSVLVPLYRSRGQGTARRAAEMSIYRDQLAELDRDAGRGLIGEGEADAARTEIARRLLRADAAKGGAPAGGQLRRRIAAAAALAVLPAAALGFYLFLGSPGLPGQPLAARLAAPPEKQDIATLVGRVEAHLAGAPEDGQGWEVIAPVYARLGRYEDAVRAYSNTIRILGSNAAREADLGDAIVRANQGVVTNAAREAFERASRLEPGAIRPRFYLALALTQEGAKPEAIAAWRALLAGAPADAPWVPVAERALAALQAPAEPAPPAAAAPPGPSEADVAAAAELTPEQRLAMIEGMVGQLAERLVSEPADAEGWARLIRSYMVLGRGEDARAALDRARTALAGDAARLAFVDQAARELGLTE